MLTLHIKHGELPNSSNIGERRAIAFDVENLGEMAIELFLCAFLLAFYLLGNFIFFGWAVVYLCSKFTDHCNRNFLWDTIFFLTYLVNVNSCKVLASQGMRYFKVEGKMNRTDLPF